MNQSIVGRTNDKHAPNCELVVLEHIHHADLTHRGAIELGPLVDAGRNQQTAVGASHNGQFRGRGVLLGNQVLGSRLEVVKHILLVEQLTGLCAQERKRWAVW